MSSKHLTRNFNAQLLLDYFFLALHREGENLIRITILTILDVATGYVALEVVPDTSTKSVRQALGGGWFRFLGPPKAIFGDSDKSWMSAEMSE